ncbi:hypothetical protein Ancab_017705 [Ancistrocladus abbreviatus]
MDSLMANYASSDEEDDQRQLQFKNLLNDSPSPPIQPTTQNPNTSSVFSSLPRPQSSPSTSSLFSSLPPPRSNCPTSQPASKDASTSNFSANKRQSQQQEGSDDEEKQQLHKESTSTSKLFSSLPPPKSLSQSDSSGNFTVVGSNYTKKVVQFRPPVAQSSSRFDDDEDEEDEEERERKKRKETSQDTSVRSFLSSIPAPRNSGTLGALSSSGSGRRLVVEDGDRVQKLDGYRVENELGVDSSLVNSEGNSIDGSSSHALGAMVGQWGGAVVAGDSTDWVQVDQSYGSYESYGNYADYGDYVHSEHCGYEGNWDNGSLGTVVSEAFGTAESVLRVSGKRGKNQGPTEIVEVKQDELMKNRPREDQVKLTGIAFGPSYQPASNKGKPSKLHKRKHQIGSLYHDMKQKEMELAERRAQGFLTKAQTQAKYGW